jgi:anti-sigma regulatory factor (Ser/Thr protein kinase)
MVNRMARALVIGRGVVPSALESSRALDDHEIQRCTGSVEALHLIRAHPVDVVVTDEATSIADDLALVREVACARPGVRIVALAPVASHDDLIAALQAHVFACFTPPFDTGEIIDMVRAALVASNWHDGLEVVSGLPHWITLRVSSHMLTADRVVRFLTEHLRLMAAEQRDLLIAAFREILLNAMEHGAGFDANTVIEVTAARTKRAIVYYVRDPGRGFDRRMKPRAASSSEPDEVVATAVRRAEMGLRPGGFGMLIARQVADELVYNERGNEVILVKYVS